MIIHWISLQYLTTYSFYLKYGIIFLTGLSYDFKQDLIYLKLNCKIVTVYWTLFLYRWSDFTEAKLVQIRDLQRLQTLISSSNRLSVCRTIKFDRLCKLLYSIQQHMQQLQRRQNFYPRLSFLSSCAKVTTGFYHSECMSNLYILCVGQR